VADDRDETWTDKHISACSYKYADTAPNAYTNSSTASHGDTTTHGFADGYTTNNLSIVLHRLPEL